jgi:serine/threonine protein kinase
MDELSCDLKDYKIIGKGVSGIVYDAGDSVIKKIPITKKNIKEVKWEIITLNKVKRSDLFPTLYAVKICSDNDERPYALLKMTKMDTNFCDWMKTDPSEDEWKSVFKQLFTIIYILNDIYHISINDIKPDNLMFKYHKLRLIDFGLNEHYNGKQLNYSNMINLYDDKYAINMYTISEELLKKGWNKHKAWKYATNYKLSKKLFKQGILDINEIKKWEYPEKIIPFIKELQKSYGKPAKYFLEEYFQVI